MIFQKTIKQVLSGQKGQTRRLVQPGDRAIFDHDLTTIFAVYRNGRLLYQVGKTYAAQPGRGQPAAGRIRLKSIRRERVNEISEGDAVAEGAKPGKGKGGYWNTARGNFADLWDSIHTGATAYEAGPEVWCLEFELCEGENKQ